PSWRGYRLVGPSLADPRLQNSLILLVVHLCGQVWFRWELSIAQILICWLTCGAIEVAQGMRRDRTIAWPAGALLTGNGIALLLRANGTVHGDWWSLHGWYYFFGISLAALVIKRYVRFQGRHIFNPSNIVLVLGFLALGTRRINPQDFWFGPRSLGLLITLVVLIVGGSAVTARLGLRTMAISFYVTFAASLGVLAATGHAMAARWSFGPAEGMVFWKTIVSSPEVFIFAFFMITDPKTTPTGRVGRAVFGTGIGLTSALLMAPQGTEFAAKVGFLSGLVIWNAAWPLLLHRWFPAPGAADDDLATWLRQLAGRRAGAPRRAPVLRTALLAAAVPVAAAAMVLAGIPARPDPAAADVAARRPTIELPQQDLPPVTQTEAFRTIQATITDDDAHGILVQALEDLEIERRAIRAGDANLASTGAAGARLEDVTTQISGGAAVETLDAKVEVIDAEIDLLRANPKAVPQLVLRTHVREPGTDDAVQATFVLALFGDQYLISAFGT
ncbi:MAG: RnfABCDGE type electron transport complex subunit D, partial [Acidimicrobiales bacterium]|nr:RnfABCDGE type electron transport complex subunit D [Acidimicrobiales bacterium]